MISRWKDLDLAHFQDIYLIETLPGEDEETKRIRRAAVLADRTYEELINIPMNELRGYIENSAFLYDEEYKPEKAKRYYTLNGREYKAIRNMEDMTTAQFIDFQSIADTYRERLVDFIAIFLIPKGHIYNDGYDREEHLKDIASMRVEEALGLADFFIKQYRRSYGSMLLYCEAKAATVRIMSRDKEIKKAARQAEKIIRETRRQVRSFGLQ